MIVLVMGTTGAGKTTVGKLLAEQLNWPFLDADNFHPAANVEKMTRGIPLDDTDRVPWLAAIHSELICQTKDAKSCVLACSALKQSYRDTLGDGLDMKVVYLKGSYEEMRTHILSRRGHFAGEGILAGQFRDLEEPKGALVVPVTLPLNDMVQAIKRGLQLS